MMTAAVMTSSGGDFLSAVCRLFFILYPVLVTSSSKTSWSASRGNNVLQERTCSEHLQKVYNDNVVAELPPRVTGLWTSQACEVRPGPEYVLRQYRFYDGGLFDLRLFHYFDSDCRNASHGLSARGQFRHYQSSWIVPGAAENDYQLRYASVVPYSAGAAFSLRQKLTVDADKLFDQNGNRNTSLTPDDFTGSKACALAVGPSPWSPYERRDVYNYVENEDFVETGTQRDGDGNLSTVDPQSIGRSLDLDCLELIDASFHEIQLMRLEQRQHLAKFNDSVPGGDVIRTLLLGDIHTERYQRHFYRPMGFQEPLALHGSTGCGKICDVISRATDLNPPLLPVTATRERLTAEPPAVIASRLVGSWASLRCETRSYGIFLTRHFQFSIGAIESLVDGKRKWTWSARHAYFGDVTCRRLMYTVDTIGSYRVEDRRSDVESRQPESAERNAEDWHHIEFNTSRIQLTVYDKRTIRQLNHFRSCGLTTQRQQWRVGDTRDVTATSGCQPIGLHIADSESDIVRVASSSTSRQTGPPLGSSRYHGNTMPSPQQHLLYFGQRPTDGSHLGNRSRRPTSFQPPMIRCNAAAVSSSPTVSNPNAKRVKVDGDRYWQGQGRNTDGGDSFENENGIPNALQSSCYVIVKSFPATTVVPLLVAQALWQRLMT